MIELGADESALLQVIREQPGATVRGLAVTLKRRPAAIVALVRALDEAGKVERRPISIQRSDGRAQPGLGLYAIAVPARAESNGSRPVDPNVCPSCGVRRRHFEGGAECQATRELRDLGRQLDWQRVPYGYGKVIMSGEPMWDEFFNRADYPSLMAGIRHAREWVSLNDQIRRQYVGAGQP